MKLPAYVIMNRGKYRYNPPDVAVKAGVVKRVTMGEQIDYERVNEWNALVHEFSAERRHLLNISTRSTLDHLIKAYKESMSYSKLAMKTKIDYDYYLSVWFKSRLGGVPLLSAKLGDIAAPMCQKVYEEHAQHSVSLANHSLAVYRLVFSFAVRNGYAIHNPFAAVQKHTEKPRRTVWSKEHIIAFMDKAFSHYSKRGVGLIVYMAYEWGQRLGDIRLLTWDKYDVDTGVLTLEQSKRRARVTIPTSPELMEMLKQQQKELGWQKYVAPSSIPDRKGGLIPYSMLNLGRIGAELMQEAGIPPELKLMDLRRTAITELVEAGVPLPNIMALSGHATPHSLTPYMKPTLKSSTLAQQMRKHHNESNTRV